MAMLQTVDDEFDERNVVLFLALGTIRCSRRLDHILETGLSASRPQTADVQTRADEALLDAVLGLIALRDRMMAALEQAALAPKPDRPQRADAELEVSPLRTLLR